MAERRTLPVSTGTDGGAPSAPASGPPVTVVTVAFRSGAVIGDMLASVPADVPVVVVDNDGIDAPTPVPERPRLQVLREPRNLGFGAACNRGAAVATTPLILFLNPDARLRPGALEELVSAAARRPRAVAFNPTLLDGRGRPHAKRRSVLLPRSQWLSRVDAHSELEAPVLTGAALLVRAWAFERVGGFDERIFLYHEDDDLSLRLRRFGPLWLVPDAVVDHAEGRSSARDAAMAAWKGRHQGRSRVYAARKHRVPFGTARVLARAVLACLHPFVLVPRKRRKAWGYLRGVLDGMRSPVSPDG